MLQIPLGSGLGEVVEIGDGLAGGDETEAGIVTSEALQEGGEARVLDRQEVFCLPAMASARSVRFKIFPRVFFGNSLRISRSRGHL